MRQQAQVAIFETPRKRSAPQDDDGGVAISEF
jgi:hypothetical protein